VFPVWFVARLVKTLARGNRSDLVDVNSRNRQA
jgi:hypothetical protein